MKLITSTILQPLILNREVGKEIANLTIIQICCVIIHTLRVTMIQISNYECVLMLPTPDIFRNFAEYNCNHK